MMMRLDNLKLHVNESENRLYDIATKKLGQKPVFFRILKKSLDARDKNNIFWTYSIAFSSEPEEQPESLQKIKNPPRVAIIGAGPAGLMCAVRLVEYGFMPIIIERGECVEDRQRTVNVFFTDRKLNVNSNVQFGEGGAGTFSDGKLNTQTHDGLNKDVLKLFRRFGAPEEILYLNKPHIGSDVLAVVLKNIRKYIEENGGTYLFNTQFTDFTQSGGKLKSLILKNTITGQASELFTDIAVAALGHSSRDTFIALYNSGMLMEPREFALGVRVEHLAKNISFAQYGNSYAKLPAADYKLVSHAHERTVFTFCMCPGGVVIPSSSEEGGVVTNGMSLYARKGVNSNSAVMVHLTKQDFGADDIFAGMRFQQKIERLAYECGGSSYCAPVQLYQDFCAGRVSSGFGEVLPTYSAGTTFAPLDSVLPPIVCQALKAAFPDFGKRVKGFDAPDTVLTGAETRFSSPVRLLRDETLQSVSLKNFYPCGEGSGYSGGITSSAADGLKIAEKLANIYRD